MTLRDEILAVCNEELLNSKDFQEIARIVSIGRIKRSTREIGNGTILEVLGFVTGNKLLDEIQTNPNFRYVKPLMEQGRMVVGSPLVQSTLQALVPSILTKEEADRMAAVGFDPDPVSALDVAIALYNPDGSRK